MSRLLHIDSSIRREGSRSRLLTSHYVGAWRAANPGGAVVHRDLDAPPVPHFDLVAHTANLTAPHERTSEQRAARAATEAIVREVLDADTILLGMGSTTSASRAP